jgi:hypothetical protein
MHEVGSGQAIFRDSEVHRRAAQKRAPVQSLRQIIDRHRRSLAVAGRRRRRLSTGRRSAGCDAPLVAEYSVT